MSPQHVPVIVRSATEADLEGVDELVRQFVHGHPAESPPRPLSRLREAYFGASPVAHLLVACKGSKVIGMGQWTRIYDMFWAMFAGRVERAVRGPGTTWAGNRRRNHCGNLPSGTRGRWGVSAGSYRRCGHRRAVRARRHRRTWLWISFVCGRISCFRGPCGASAA